MSNLHCYACGLPIALDDTLCARCKSPLLLYNIYQMQRVLQPKNDNGTVYLARHRRLNADLVVKQAPVSLAGYIRNEAQILQSLRRRLDFTPHVYDFRTDDQHVVLIMEFIEGQTLDHVYPQQPWPIQEVMLFLDELLQHLEELHAADIIHRDLKPQNIIRRPNGSYALIDFNVAKHKGEKTEYIGHTRRYAPPEQLDQAKKRRSSSPKVATDERSDLYSLAATAYELLTGQLFVLQSDIPLVLRGEAVPAELRAALTQMLASDMADRPPTATTALRLLNPNRVLSPRGRHATNLANATGATLPLDNRRSQEQIDAEAATAWVAPATAGREVGGDANVPEQADQASHIFPAEEAYGRITGIAWSPIAPELAIATARGIRIYNISVRKERAFHQAPRPLRSIGYTSHGHALTWAIAGRAYVHDLSNGTCIYTSPVDSQYAPGVIVPAPRSQTLAIATEGGVHVFDIAQKTLKYSCEAAIEPHLTVSSETGDRIITVSEQHITIWRGNPRENPFKIPDNITVRPITGLALSPDGRTLVVASASTVEIWHNSNPINTITLTQRIRSIALSPNGRRLALLTSQGIQIYSIDIKHLEIKKTAELAQTAEIAPRCFQMAFDKDSTYLAAATPGIIRIWDANQRKTIETLSYTDNPRYLAFTPDGELLASVGHDIQIYDIQNQTGPIKPQVADRASKIYHGIAFARDGKMLAVASGDAITLWQRRTVPRSAQTFMATAVGEPRPEINPWRKLTPKRSCKVVQAHSLTFARLPEPDLMKIDHAKIDIWPVASSSQNAQARAVPFPLPLSGNDAYEPAHLYDIALAPSGWVAATSASKTVHIWNVDDEDKAVKPLQLDFLPNSVALSPDGKLLAAVAHDTLQVWDVQSKKPIYTAPDAEYGAERVVFAPDSVTFATINHTDLRIWRMDGPTMHLIYRAREHTDTITDIAFADDLRTFASASDDGTIRVWINKLASNNTLPPSPPVQHNVRFDIAVLPPHKLNIFLCHVTEDLARITGLSQHLRELGFKIWDTSDITPGQQWQNRVRSMIEQSDIFIACLSSNLINKSRSSFAHDEIDFALKFAETLPEDSIYIIPLRLGSVTPPEPLRRWQWVDYFDDRVPEQLVAALEKRAQAVAKTKSNPSDSSPKPNAKKSAEIHQLKLDLECQRDALRILQSQIGYVGWAHAPVDKILDANNRRKAVWRIKARLDELKASYTSALIDDFEA